jgi:hypothetical protein
MSRVGSCEGVRAWCYANCLLVTAGVLLEEDMTHCLMWLRSKSVVRETSAGGSSWVEASSNQVWFSVKLLRESGFA